MLSNFPRLWVGRQHLGVPEFTYLRCHKAAYLGLSYDCLLGYVCHALTQMLRCCTKASNALLTSWQTLLL